MTRTSKPAGNRSQKKSKGGTLIGIFIGLVLGILIALAVVWYMNRTPTPFTSKAPATGAAETRSGTNGAPAANGKGAEPGEKRFQFYEILPGKAEPQPGKTPDKGTDKGADKPIDKAADKAATGKSGDAAKPAADLFLQAGSFQNAKDAENLKASLALMGQEASVQQVMLSDKVWYRVRLGPFASNDAAGKARAELAKSGIEASLVKGKD